MRLDAVLISTSELFQDLYPDTELPAFVRLIPEGRVELGSREEVLSWSGHDACLSQKADMIVSRRFLRLLRQHRIDHCEIRALTWAQNRGVTL